MDNSTCYQKNRDVILKRAKDYYYNNIEAIRKKWELNIKIFQKKIKKKFKNIKKNTEKK